MRGDPFGRVNWFLGRQKDEVVDEVGETLPLRERRGQIRLVARILHDRSIKGLDGQEPASMDEMPAIVQGPEELCHALHTAGRKVLDHLDQNARSRSSYGTDRSLEDGDLVAFDVDLYEPDLAVVDVVEALGSYDDFAKTRIVRERGGRDAGASFDGNAADDRHTQGRCRPRVGKRRIAHFDLAGETRAENVGERWQRFERDDPSRAAPHEIRVAAVVRADVDGVSCRVAEVAKNVQLDFAVAGIKTCVAPVQECFWQRRA